MFETLQKYMSDDETARFLAKNPTATVEPKKTQQKRNYSAARVDRTTADWITSATTVNQVLRLKLRWLRQRSRDLARNDPYAKKYFRLVKSNVIGVGIKLQIRTNDKNLQTDAKLTSSVERSFKEWTKKKNCTLSGKLSWLEAQKLFVTYLARDGEALVRIVLTNKNRFGIALKFYSPQWLDETYNDTRPNGNRVIMSVEVNDDDEPQAYWFTPPVSDYQLRNKLKYRFRVPASEIIHSFFVSDDEDQTRGVPSLHASMLRLKMLDGFEEAEVIAARVEACQMGFAIPPKDENAEMTDGEDEDGNPIYVEESIEPGVIRELPPGYDFKTFDPKHPNPNAGDFKKTVLRGAAAGAEISYHTLAGDLEAVNYSSARIGMLDDRDVWNEFQTFVIENFCEPVFARWLESSFLNNSLEISLKDFNRLEPVFRGRGWTWVDPKKEADAHVVALQNKFETLTDVLAEKGVDLEDHFETLKKERELAEKYGFDLEEIYNPNPKMEKPAEDDEEKPKSEGKNQIK